MDKAVAAGVPQSVDGWIILRLAGDPRERGIQHGRALADEIKRALDAGDFMARQDSGDGLAAFARCVDEAFAPLEDEYLTEIRGIAEGVASVTDPVTPGGLAITPEVLIAWNGYNELIGNVWPSESPGTPARSVLTKGGLERCSAFIATGAATAGGKIVMAHNTWDRYAMGDHYNVILDIWPTEGHRILMQAAPGYISSNADWLVTGAGLMITETTIGGFTGFAKGRKAEFQRSRKAAQYSRDLGEWCGHMVDGNNGGYANTWLLGETRTGRIARFDLGLKFQGYEEKSDGYFSGYNVASDLRVRNVETRDPGTYSDIRSNGSRRLRFDQLLQASDLTADRAKEIIADHYDVYQEKEQPNSRTICGHLDLDDARLGNHGQGPFYPWGANDGKVMDSDMARDMRFEARWGHSCDLGFDAKDFLQRHPQYAWLEGRMAQRPRHEWQSILPAWWPPPPEG